MANALILLNVTVVMTGFLMLMVSCRATPEEPPPVRPAIELDEAVLRSHLLRLKALANEQRDKIIDGHVTWIRVHHAGEETFRQEVEPLLDLAYNAAPPSPTDFDRRWIVLLREEAPSPRAGVPLSHENVIGGAFAESNRIWTGHRQTFFDAISGSQDEFSSDSADPWKQEFYRWISLRRPQVILERPSDDSFLLSGLFLLHRDRRKEAHSDGDFQAFCWEARLEVSFLFASAIQRDLDLRAQVEGLLEDQPSRHVVSAFGAGHDPGLILGSVKSKEIRALRGIEGSAWETVVYGIRQRLLNPGPAQLPSVEDSIRYRGLASFMVSGLGEGQTVEQANEAAEGHAATVLDRFGTWTEWVRNTEFQPDH